MSFLHCMYFNLHFLCTILQYWACPSMYFLYPLQLNYEVTNKQLPWHSGFKEDQTSYITFRFEFWTPEQWLLLWDYQLGPGLTVSDGHSPYLLHKAARKTEIYLSSSHAVLMHIILWTYAWIQYSTLYAHDYTYITGPHSSICPTLQIHM